MRYILLLVCLVALAEVSFAENTQPGETRTLRQQYAELKSKQEVINGFRMVKLYEMDQLWRIVEDSLQAKHNAVREGLARVENQATEIKSLKSLVRKTEGEKQTLVSGVDNITVMGKPYSKAGFVTSMVVLIAALTVLVVVLFVWGKATFKNTRECKRQHEDLYKEFEAYKHNAVEKSIKLSRELQSLKNRMAELKIA